MSWTDLVLAPAPGKGVLPVSLSCSAADGRFEQALRLLVRPDLLDGGLDWWTPKAWVRVQLGHGEHDGVMRLSRGENARFQLTLSGGHRGRTVLVLRGFRPLSAAAQRNVAVDYDHGDGWLELHLPPWARATRPVPAPQPAPQPPRGIMPALTPAQIDAAVARRKAAAKGAVP